MVRKVQKEKLHVAFLTAYPSEQAVDRPRTQAARDAAREASGTSDSSDVDMDADTDDVEEDLDPLEELEEEEMEGPAVTPLPFRREFPSAKITCPACKAGWLEHIRNHTHVPGNCKYPPCLGCKHRRHMDHKDHTRKE